jgi:hypothetical protein
MLVPVFYLFLFLIFYNSVVSILMYPYAFVQLFPWNMFFQVKLIDQLLCKLLFILAVLSIQPRAFCILSTYSTSELHPTQPLVQTFKAADAYC